MERPFDQVDVFAEAPQAGNPLAVVADGTGLTAEDMQRFATWTNLSETTFLLPPTDPAADYLVRIFTPAQELPFAGHPTLGTCRVWLDRGGQPRTEGTIVQQCGVGLVPIAVDGDRLAFRAPPLIKSGDPTEAELAEALRATGLSREAVVDAAWIDNGPGWIGLLLASAEEVLAIEPSLSDQKIGVVGLYPPGSPAAIEVRAFFSKGSEMAEDPVTGSLNASVAQWLIGSGRISPPYLSNQGRRLGHDGQVHITARSGEDGDAEIWVGGEVMTVISGSVFL
ncbi:MAG: PhzF family phenazine biosynthesis protein [Actinomycetota bacterium]